MEHCWLYFGIPLEHCVHRSFECLPELADPLHPDLPFPIYLHLPILELVRVFVYRRYLRHCIKVYAYVVSDLYWWVYRLLSDSRASLWKLFISSDHVRCDWNNFWALTILQLLDWIELLAAHWGTRGEEWVKWLRWGVIGNIFRLVFSSFLVFFFILKLIYSLRFFNCILVGRL